MKKNDKKPKVKCKAEVLNSLKNREYYETEETMCVSKAIEEYCEECVPFEKIKFIKAELRAKKLFDIEIYQLLELWPKSLLCLQLVIEEMEERYTEEELNYILMLFN
ncbi:hypothetical protein EDEG_00823 [Edhazardia aedis USNM 41457]|uniref:DNA-directed RNA polymerase III subunit RPC9 n=1 Tax=Edhazardia aedis (strain USNM 41457) TaxID=1003232 RepID=J9DUU5_EDHAE|nr:hypothetical protein EDEG_00823 [Edhazardia aedis USNM 41457]|eukprot:EJW05042.1 hypothetical protein EDEG_00823 [Edhazardia aedis USNM 41457]